MAGNKGTWSDSCVETNLRGVWGGKEEQFEVEKGIVTAVMGML